jgi:hypothetical protein
MYIGLAREPGLKSCVGAWGQVSDVVKKRGHQDCGTIGLDILRKFLAQFTKRKLGEVRDPETMSEARVFGEHVYKLGVRGLADVTKALEPTTVYQTEDKVFSRVVLGERYGLVNDVCEGDVTHTVCPEVGRCCGIGCWVTTVIPKLRSPSRKCVEDVRSSTWVTPSSRRIWAPIPYSRMIVADGEGMGSLRCCTEFPFGSINGRRK